MATKKEIKKRQCLLFLMDYYVDDIDGIWGQLSKVATKSFKGDYGGLPVNDTYDSTTEKALRHAIAYGMPAKKVESASGTFWDGIKYFKRSEFACKCGKHCNGYPTEMDEDVVKVVDDARKHFGAPGTVSSGLRCATHNANVGGVSNSRHLKGKAVDISIAGVSGNTLKTYFEKQSKVRYTYVIEGNWVHVDVE